MFDPGVGVQFSGALVNTLVVALWPVLPGLILLYLRQSLVTRRIRPDFSLRKFEMIELDRALLLHRNVRCRLDTIKERGKAKKKTFWQALSSRSTDDPQDAAYEFEDLESQLRYLRTIIIRLRRRPLQRLTSWTRAMSSQFAFGGALAAHVTGLALLIVAFHALLQPASAAELTTTAAPSTIWYPFDERLFFANAIATSFAALAAPLFYIVRWAGLRQEYWLEFCALKELASADPAHFIDQSHDGDAAQQHWRQTGAGQGDRSWFAVLGLSPTATIDDVKQAYKLLIKQSHPDRVHGMSPAFKALAEAETKKINEAYRQALLAAVPSL
jgi:hypothetical protein